MGVSKGQTEAAAALGLRPGPTLRLVVIPQAMRIIIPPLTSQYLNLTKNSSLAIAIGYPDLVAIGGTILNQTGQAIEIVAIWMVVYLGDQPAHLRVHELVQRPHGAGGEVGAMQGHDLSFVRAEMALAQPAPPRGGRLRPLGAQEPFRVALRHGSHPAGARTSRLFPAAD